MADKRLLGEHGSSQGSPLWPSGSSSAMLRQSRQLIAQSALLGKTAWEVLRQTHTHLECGTQQLSAVWTGERFENLARVTSHAHRSLEVVLLDARKFPDLKQYTDTLARLQKCRDRLHELTVEEARSMLVVSGLMEIVVVKGTRSTRNSLEMTLMCQKPCTYRCAKVIGKVKVY